ncbi:hypothetical protein NM688_g2986 [Phlebia brevispora]|uniref:Uncharacterized protein n=1 Tax=Phlebia brevispora TaxID=194682 RepID=A0ACC1T6T5_9APHY|nr:hypothetical protein NM688_g2986 [Phlebia brevispora]
MQDGTIISVFISLATLSVTGHLAHAFPIERIAFHGNSLMLASGAHREIKVWRASVSGEWEHETDIHAPPATSMNRDLEILVTGLHWKAGGRRSPTLIVSYMYHGIMYVLDLQRISTVKAYPYEVSSTARIGCVFVRFRPMLAACERLLAREATGPYRLAELILAFPTMVAFSLLQTWSPVST